MTKKLLFVGGIVNAFFVLFHLFLGYRIYRLQGLPRDVHALLQMLNWGGALFILFFAIAFLVYPRDVLSTKSGGLSFLFCFLLYSTRALEEVLLSPRFSGPIFISCAAVALLFLYLWLIRKRGISHG